MKRKEAILALLLTFPLILASNKQEEVVEEPKQSYEIYYVDIEPEPLDLPIEEVVAVPETVPEVIEEVHTEIEKVYFDTELSKEMQDYIMEICEKYNMAPSLVIAVIERESRCNPEAVGDYGDSIGLMQIQEQWHSERMARLGVTNLFDPEQNIAVGVDFLHELSQMNDDLYWVLMCYNGGKRYADNHSRQGVVSEYANWIVERSIELDERRDSECVYLTCCQ